MSFNADNIISVKEKKFHMEVNMFFGSIDTTGTASGVFKSHIINKAIFETFMKRMNYLLLVWIISRRI